MLTPQKMPTFSFGILLVTHKRCQPHTQAPPIHWGNQQMPSLTGLVVWNGNQIESMLSSFDRGMPWIKPLRSDRIPSIETRRTMNKDSVNPCSKEYPLIDTHDSDTLPKGRLSSIRSTWAYQRHISCTGVYPPSKSNNNIRIHHR